MINLHSMQCKTSIAISLPIYIGASKQLGTIIEGESLLNDGAAIVIFNVLLLELIPGEEQTGRAGG